MTSVRSVIDPVCGMTIDAAVAPFIREYDGESFYLCSVECSNKFDADAAAYVAASRLSLPGWGLTPHPERVTEQFRKKSSES